MQRSRLHQGRNSCYDLLQVAEEKATMGQLTKNWVCSYAGNFVGSLLMVYLVASTGLLATAPAPLNIAVAKTSLSFGQVFILSPFSLDPAVLCAAGGAQPLRVKGIP